MPLFFQRAPNGDPSSATSSSSLVKRITFSHPSPIETGKKKRPGHQSPEQSNHKRQRTPHTRPQSPLRSADAGSEAEDIFGSDTSHLSSPLSTSASLSPIVPPIIQQDLQSHQHRDHALPVRTPGDTSHAPTASPTPVTPQSQSHQEPRNNQTLGHSPLNPTLESPPRTISFHSSTASTILLPDTEPEDSHCLRNAQAVSPVSSISVALGALPKDRPLLMVQDGHVERHYKSPLNVSNSCIRPSPARNSFSGTFDVAGDSKKVDGISSPERPSFSSGDGRSNGRRRICRFIYVDEHSSQRPEGQQSQRGHCLRVDEPELDGDEHVNADNPGPCSAECSKSLGEADASVTTREPTSTQGRQKKGLATMFSDPYRQRCPTLDTSPSPGRVASTVASPPNTKSESGGVSGKPSTTSVPPIGDAGTKIAAKGGALDLEKHDRLNAGPLNPGTPSFNGPNSLQQTPEFSPNPPKANIGFTFRGRPVKLNAEHLEAARKRLGMPSESATENSSSIPGVIPRTRDPPSEAQSAMIKTELPSDAGHCHVVHDAASAQSPTSHALLSTTRPGLSNWESPTPLSEDHRRVSQKVLGMPCEANQPGTRPDAPVTPATPGFAFGSRRAQPNAESLRLARGLLGIDTDFRGPDSPLSTRHGSQTIAQTATPAGFQPPSSRKKIAPVPKKKLKAARRALALEEQSPEFDQENIPAPCGQGASLQTSNLLDASSSTPGQHGLLRTPQIQRSAGGLTTPAPDRMAVKTPGASSRPPHEAFTTPRQTPPAKATCSAVRPSDLSSFRHYKFRDGFDAHEAYISLIEGAALVKLLKPEWVENHFGWIVVKFKSLELYDPSRWTCTPKAVIEQLWRRYHREVAGDQRPAIRRIVERDGFASRPMVLFIVSVEPDLVLSDGWYKILAVPDDILGRALRKPRRSFIGHKILVTGAALEGPREGTEVLKSFGKFRLRICVNGTWRARGDAKLGYVSMARAPTSSIHRIKVGGGIVPCLDIVVLRRYPTLFVETKPDGTRVTRTAKEEDMAAEQHACSIQSELEDHAHRNSGIVDPSLLDRKLEPRKVAGMHEVLVADYPNPRLAMDPTGGCKYARVTFWRLSENDASVLGEGYRLRAYELNPRFQDKNTLCLSSTNGTVINVKHRLSDEEMARSGFRQRRCWLSPSDSLSGEGDIVGMVLASFGSSGDERPWTFFLCRGKKPQVFGVNKQLNVPINKVIGVKNLRFAGSDPCFGIQMFSWTRRSHVTVSLAGYLASESKALLECLSSVDIREARDLVIKITGSEKKQVRDRGCADA